MNETAPTVEVGAVATVGVGGAATEEEALRIRAEVKGDTEVEGIEEGVIVPTEEVEGVGIVPTEEEGVVIVPTEVVAVGPAIEEEEGVHLLPPGELGREARDLTPALLYVYTVPYNVCMYIPHSNTFTSYS